jgi:hypothetical protein
MNGHSAHESYVLAAGLCDEACVLRLAAPHPATLDNAFSVLTTLARSFGVEPERLDGRHATGVAATLPLGVPIS